MYLEYWFKIDNKDSQKYNARYKWKLIAGMIIVLQQTIRRKYNKSMQLDMKGEKNHYIMKYFENVFVLLFVSLENTKVLKVL